MGAALGLLVVVAASSWSRGAAAPAADPLVEDKPPISIDWRRGIVAATAGAAADHRMPSAEAARPGAERRARAQAQARLREALGTLPLGGGRHLDAAAVARALGRARVTDTEYQSNGGALLRMEVSFGDWMAENADDAGTEAVNLLLPEGRLAAAPIVFMGGQEIAVAWARFRMATELPAGLQPVAARLDKKGRLLVGAQKGRGEAEGEDKRDGKQGTPRGAIAMEFAARPVVVYVHKLTR